MSVVTPSYNQGQFIEETIRSILLQGYPDLEFIIIDGSSTDNTVEILRKYETWITFWVSEKDRGQAHALNKGFRKSTGLWVGWQNSDDYYGMNAFERCTSVAPQYPDVDVLHGTSHFIEENGRIINTIFTENFTPAERPDSFPLFNFSNQSMFFNRRIFDRGVFIDERYKHAMDNEFFLRLIISGCKFRFVPGMTGICRVHRAAKTFYQEEISLLEVAAICTNILESGDCSPDIQSLALRGFRSVLIALFRKCRTREFRAGTRKMIKFGGCRMLDGKFVTRYLASLVGPFILKHALDFGKR
jgi:GT2 family glycosyltransferase